MALIKGRAITGVPLTPELTVEFTVRRSKKKPLPSRAQRCAGSSQAPRVKRAPEVARYSISVVPSSTRVSGFPSTPSEAGPLVVASGIGDGPLLIHQTRYSADAQTQSPTGSSAAQPGQPGPLHPPDSTSPLHTGQ